MNDENINFLIDEIENNTNELNFDLNELLHQIEESKITHDELVVPYIINYHENYTIKELMLICEYYGIAKEIKANKCNKDIIIQILVDFETNSENNDIVFKRQNMWFYISELKNDKFMKKFILW
jgi:hypothetical protein